MKRIFLLMWFTLLSVSLYAQQEAEGRVGIGTSSPKATLDILENASLPEAQAQGVTFPNFSTDERAKFRDVKVGTMIFNTTKQCLEMYYGLKEGEHYWDCIRCNGNQQQAQDVRVEATGFEGAYIGNLALNSQNRTKFKLVNNSFLTIRNLDLSNAVQIENGGSDVAVIGRQNTSVTLNPGEEREFSWRLQGTPKLGELKAVFNKANLHAEQARTVGKGDATFTNPTITKNIVSVNSASLTVQGIIDNASHRLTIEIPYTNGQGSYDAVSVTQVSAPGQDNDVNDLTLKIAEGSFSSSGNLTATIEVGGADTAYKVKQMPLGQSYTIATFPVTINGSEFTVELKGIGGWTSTQTQSYSRSFTKNNCGSGYYGTSVSYSKEATATAVSAVSQADADQKARDKALEEAQRLVNEGGQDYANTNGRCNSGGYARTRYSGSGTCAPKFPEIDNGGTFGSRPVRAYGESISDPYGACMSRLRSQCSSQEILTNAQCNVY
ncbi:DUF5977 domain-containing protein [Ornithobacterium rhinotracheale]|uniref:DUF5977 domain-containing protein n=1 Tax=Ornithobacterium rhinotracheale TaxID=28251 RepID=UPI001FF42AAF|nr:DUF5977 domain-containing protein [Ornithobacterium rhinotracheale]MCK0204838.1 DUF5977 domain-containing protein [Ornithobacterium rhinotracheale]